MVMHETAWGEQIDVESVRGVSYRMYGQRPRRLSELLGMAARWGGQPYVLQQERRISFGEMAAAVSAKSRLLASMGVGKGSRVFLLGWNSPEWVVNFWACFRVGAVPVLANTWWSASEVEAGLRLVEPQLVLADGASQPKVPPNWPLGLWGEAAEQDESKPAPEDAGSDEEDTALIIFTSGTSGRPKAVVLSHRAVLARLQTTLHITRKLPHQISEASHDVTLITGPLFHVGGMQTLLRAWVVGDALVLSHGRYDPADVLSLIERHKVNRWNAVPTMVSRLLDQPDVARRDVGSLKSISIGGAPVHKELMQRIREGLPSVSPRIPTGYGLTENGGQATAAAGTENVELLGSTGRPLPTVEVRFLARDGYPDGEILLRSPTQMSGYYGLSESPIDSEGWLHTGDLGRLDEKGHLWITGRCKDMIIRGGENIAPAAVEQALVALPGVSEAVVFGVPHPDLGEEVMAVVVADPVIASAELQAGLRGKVASFAIPSRWALQHEPLATNHTGKVDKTAIRAKACADMAKTKMEAL